MKVHRLVVAVIDFDGLGADGVKTTIEDTRYPNHCIAPKVVSVETADIGEWEDSNPLNRSDTHDAEFTRLFPAARGPEGWRIWKDHFVSGIIHIVPPDGVARGYDCGAGDSGRGGTLYALADALLAAAPQPEIDGRVAIAWRSETKHGPGYSFANEFWEAFPTFPNPPRPQPEAVKAEPAAWMTDSPYVCNSLTKDKAVADMWRERGWNVAPLGVIDTPAPESREAETMRDWSARMAKAEAGQYVGAGSHGIDDKPEAVKRDGDYSVGRYGEWGSGGKLYGDQAPGYPAMRGSRAIAWFVYRDDAAEWVASKVNPAGREPEAGQRDGVPYGIIDPDYARIYTIARCLAWSEGYALAMHGSFTRDLDLIAVPWAERACEPEHLVNRIVDAAGLSNKIPSNPGAKPHGRLAWTLHLPGFGDPRWVDLSIMPRLASAQQANEWRCFHCDERFTDKDAAALHFGTHEYQEPACLIDIAKYREMEALQLRYADEDACVHRTMRRMETEHQQALRSAEEAGYARGLADAAKYPEEVATLAKRDGSRGETEG